MVSGTKTSPWRRKRNLVTHKKNAKIAVREGHATVLSDEEIKEYFSPEKFSLYGLRYDFNECCRRLKEILKDDSELAYVNIDNLKSFQELIRFFIRHPLDVRSKYGRALQEATGLHPVFLDWIAEPYWENGEFPFLNFPEQEFALWEEAQKKNNNF